MELGGSNSAHGGNELIGAGCNPQVEGCKPAESLKKPYASYGGLQKVSWAEALQWWPHDPVFHATSLPRSGWIEEAVFAGSQPGGTKGKPATDFGLFGVVYEYPPATVDQTDYYGIIDGGGFIVQIHHHPAGDPVPFAGEGKPVSVRGVVGRLLIFTKKGGSNVDWRGIHWERLSKSGGTIQWVIGNNPNLNTDSDTVEWVNALEEVSE